MNNNFFRKWSIKFVGNTQRSGYMNISRSSGVATVSGDLGENQLPGQRFDSIAVFFPSTNRIQMDFRTSSGSTGSMVLDISESLDDGIVTAVSSSGEFKINGESVEQIELSPIFDIGDQIGSNFTYSSNISSQQKATLLERHRFAYGQIERCDTLTSKQKNALRIAYTRQIDHDVNTTPGVNASAFVGGNQVFVNFDVLFPQGDREIAQTLIHEMMHCAGYTHPTRTSSDIPGDGGVYYSTPPLQSEICIAGVQSDVACVFEEGQCVLHL